MLKKPYRRIIRPFPEDTRPGFQEQFPYRCHGSSRDYLKDEHYASGRIEAVRAYCTLERDLIHLFDYVEPADKNLETFSIRLYELLLRACTEVEAHCRAILTANGYQKSGDWYVSDYRKVDKSSRLSDYHIKVIIWRNEPKIIRPFAKWAHDKSTEWYDAYNAVKHNRHIEFGHANLRNVVNAVAAVRVVLFSQLFVDAFYPRDSIDMYSTDDDGYLSYKDSVFALRPPQTWTDEQRYDFEWNAIEGQPDRFQNFPF